MRSATYGEVLDLALDRSENALTENLVRQAAATAGRSTTKGGDNAAFVVERLTAHGIPTEGLVLKDASGLSPGQAASAATLSVLHLAATDSPDQVPGLRDVIAGLPVSGVSGTMRGRPPTPPMTSWGCLVPRRAP